MTSIRSSSLVCPSQNQEVKIRIREASRQAEDTKFRILRLTSSIRISRPANKIWIQNSLLKSRNGKTKVGKRSKPKKLFTRRNLARVRTMNSRSISELRRQRILLWTAKKSRSSLLKLTYTTLPKLILTDRR